MCLRLFHLYLQEQLKDLYTILCCEIPSVKDVWKWVIGSQIGKITKTDFTPYSNFQISLSVTYPDTAKECFKLFQKCPEAFPNRKKRKATEEEIYTRAAILKAVELVSSEINSLFTFPPSPPDKSCIFHDILCTRSPLYLGGRYNKYSRELSQTPWIVDGERRMDSSVNELITNVVQRRIYADKIVFSASGREDVDVKMLGNGRPFVLEILNPRRVKLSDAEMKDIENEINASTDSIAVKDLQIITKQDTLLLKEGEEQKRKTYSAICIVKKTLSQNDVDKLLLLKDLKIQQKTPIRVLHRRNLATRERLLHSIDAKLLDSHLLHLKLETQAGTYVKEFVHGDFGRTSPNLGMLLDTEADILELDVECIHLDWPPKTSS
ncbi:tRNA pseudouridine synthase Pus10-like [Stegodyphus dumicola]|uniref:tRNA pseudouridine synthase Pus10-like n=1 Tax=Stegodyphus dumicola TaxID=202533 RepID=UPI0015AA98B8|nr:tRNA pseudouridine synthase Pus10-like [Stegodyphus dumicola]